MSISSRSKNSMAVGTAAICRRRGTMSMQLSRFSKGITRVRVNFGAGISFKVTSVRMHRVPSEPITRSLIS